MMWSTSLPVTIRLFLRGNPPVDDFGADREHGYPHLPKAYS